MSAVIKRDHFQKSLSSTRQEKYRKYAFMANASSDFMSLINRDLEYEVVNDAYRKALGPGFQDIEGKKLTEIWKPAILEKSVMPNLRKCFDGEFIFHEEWFQFHQYGYGYFEVHFSPFYDDSGTVSHVAVVSRDTTERKIASEESKRVKEEWEKTFHSVSDMILIVARDYQIVRLNKSAAKKLNLTAEEAVGRYCYEVVHGTSEPPEYCPQAELMANGRNYVVEVRDDFLGGFFVFNMFPFGDEDCIEASVHIIRDITGRRKAEEEREQLIYELKNAVREVKKLQGMIPICASCKKIRDDKGYWQQIEKYIQDHSDAKFSHSICPECAQRLYPDLYREIMRHKILD